MLVMDLDWQAAHAMAGGSQIRLTKTRRGVQQLGRKQQQLSEWPAMRTVTQDQPQTSSLQTRMQVAEFKSSLPNSGAQQHHKSIRKANAYFA